MMVKTFKQFSLNRPELEEAIRNFCGIDPEVNLDGFWVVSDHLKAPRPVCGFTVVAEAAE